LTFICFWHYICSINQSIIKKEAIHRASKIAEAEGNPTLEVEHLQKILPQLLLDF